MPAFKGYGLFVYPPSGGYPGYLRVTEGRVIQYIAPNQTYALRFEHPAGTSNVFDILVEHYEGDTPPTLFTTWEPVTFAQVKVSAGQFGAYTIPVSGFGGVDEDQAAFDAAANQANKPTSTHYAVMGLGLIAAILVLPKLFHATMKYDDRYGG